MSKLFDLEILTPERLFFKGEIESLSLDTETGSRGLLAGAAPLVCALKPGVIRILHNKKWSEALNSGSGFLSVGADGATILTEKCLWPHELGDQPEEPEEAYHSERSAREYKAAKETLTEKLIKKE